MKLMGILCVPLFCTIHLLAQTANTAQAVLICDESAGCTHQFVNGQKVKILSSNGITVSVSMFDTGKYFLAEITVLNSSPTNIDVLPPNFSVEETSPKPKTLAYVDAEKIIRSAQRRMAWANAFTAAGAGMQQQQTTTNTTSNGTVNVNSSDGTYANGTYNGTSTSTTNTPDYAAQARANEAIRERNATLATQSAQLENAALKSNTLVSGQTIGGRVFFERKGKVSSLALSVPSAEQFSSSLSRSNARKRMAAFVGKETP